MKLRINNKRVEWEGGGIDLPIRALDAIRHCRVYNPLAMKLRGKPESGVGDRTASSREEAASGVALEYCPNCSAKLVGQSCKLKCPRCGYFLSCSDYY